MKRRTALKNLSLVGGLASLPSWAFGWTPESIASTQPADDEALMGELVETIIPETSTPGAKSLKVHQFVGRMVRDCYDANTQQVVKQGLQTTNDLARQAYGKEFGACDTAQRLAVFQKMSASTDRPTKQFADLVKGLTIRGYTNSEYYMTNVLHYEMAPGYYHGCVPVKA
ncbi:MAG: gluconate 2-dehydrogenase subunit 3 family protein [Spirosomataceae bacterium]